MNRRLVYSTASTEPYVETPEDRRMAHRAKAARIQAKEQENRNRFPRPEIVNAMNSWCKKPSLRHYLNNKGIRDLEDADEETGY